MRKFCRFWWECACIGARGNTAFANDWQWLFGVPAVAGIITGLAADKWAASVSVIYPILYGVAGAFGAFVVTWLIACLIRTLNAPVVLLTRERDLAAGLRDQIKLTEQTGNERATELQDKIDSLLRWKEIMKARKNLAILRNKAVPMRHEGAGLKSKEQVPAWTKKVDKWLARTIRVIRKIDSADAEKFKVLNYTNHAQRLVNPLCDDHERYYRCIDEWTYRLEENMKRYEEWYGRAPIKTIEP